MQTGIACDLCDSTTSQSYLVSPDASPFGLVRCRSCGLVYLDPRPGPEEIGHYYTEEYYTSQPPLHAPRPGLRQRLKRLAYRARCEHPAALDRRQRLLLGLVRLAIGWRVRRHVPALPRGRLLDVGCGNGEWIAGVRESLPGWTVEGVETNLHAARQARDVFALEVHAGHLQQLPLPTEAYDMVSFWHSLEHTHSPSLALKTAQRLLRRGGWVAVEVPNIESWEARTIGSTWYHLAIPFHLYHFSPATLRRLLERCGFRLLKTEYVYGCVGLQSALDQGALKTLIPRNRLGYETCRVLGAVRPWGVRVYGVKR